MKAWIGYITADDLHSDNGINFYGTETEAQVKFYFYETEKF